MKIEILKPSIVDVHKMNIFLKCRDEFSCTLYDIDGNKVLEYEGYVPSIVPGHDGDYLDLIIDVNTGQILNWDLTAVKLKKFINEFKD